MQKNIRANTSLSLRRAIRLTLIASALSVAQFAKAGPDACTSDGLFIHCTGDQHDGVYNEWDNILYIHDLTQGIVPAIGNTGIVHYREGITTSQNTIWDGSGSITARDASGIYARTYYEPFLNGRAGDVTVGTYGGDIVVSGNARYDAIFAESYGQESAVDLPDSGGTVVVENRANILNQSANGNGIYAHSWATYSGTGGYVRVTSDANIHTMGQHANAIFALSEGGYGANGSSGFDGSSGVPGGIGGDVLVEGSGVLTTDDADSHGVLAISRGGIGGSGGDGWVANAGNGVFGGGAGTVTVDGSWNIHTAFENSSGIYAESLGGEGGEGGEGFTFGSGGSGGGSGDGNVVSVTSRGSISTRGDYSYGIFAHSVGGFAGGGRQQLRHRGLRRLG
jgi:hypothetical protein